MTEADYLRVIKRDPSRTGAEPRATDIELTLADGDDASAHRARSARWNARSTRPPARSACSSSSRIPTRCCGPGSTGGRGCCVDTKAGALLVPQRAVQELQNLYSVAVVGSGDKVAFRNVKVGPRVDSMWVIEEGLKPGEQVVAEGLQAIRDGMAVRTKPMPAPHHR